MTRPIRTCSFPSASRGWPLCAAGLLFIALNATLAAQSGLARGEADTREMTRLVDEYLALYDPGNRSLERELEFCRRLFETGPDFFMVVDAVTFTSWADREAQTRQRAAQPAGPGDREGVHDTVVERIRVLGPDAAVLTRTYRYRFTDAAGKKGHQDGSVTCLFERRNRQWKVVQYHGSHRPRVVE